MKKIALLTAFIGLFVSCSSDITDLNEEAKRPASTQAEYLFTNAQKTLVDQMVNTSVNRNVFRLFSQHWTETTYPDESQYDITTRTIPDFHFATLYRDVLADFKEANRLLDLESPATAEETAILANKKAVLDILSAYSYSVLVDTFGDIPYTEALDIQNHPLPKYDDAQTIYKDLISRLTADANSLTANSAAGSFADADLIYGGNSAKWAKFANSLRLRMAVNMSDVDAAYAKTEAEKATTAGVITSNADNTNLVYLPLQPNANPLYADLVVSGRNDFIPANTLVNKMNALNDPRRAKYFTLYSDGTYKGGIYGASNAFGSFSHITATLNEPTFPGTLMDATEVEFLLAEAAAKGAAVGAAATHYNNAIAASMENWGVASADATAYLTANPYSAANYKQVIGEQAWIALFNRGFEAWTSYRRLDFPVLTVPAVTYNGITEVPKRYSYPAREQTLNRTNVSAAIAKIPGGKNTLTAKVFWDKF
ncbi:MAG TPA: SusD/RagB family nutrient-binding outer membrane lipoprotein [Flavobacterium sp.]|uniref:SusD/RagB family nutrient-binding outer membrane lipoprotein n=1 Tax=Flavobacterium sp. TaxID=239 RepID=UPI002DBA6B8C|nr:SusD/RagB family nutrient-binding outer membrane lipoprotein [Flavobacterium sp.]HEU4789474.1 SusD/RagB family nutrient-binding outer membrane lipoprotein [Flavobacterium sp.]